ncbi:hypothetical protein C8Q70DRAFT_933581 [Cubamyces menziesii]|nr:hypothetical protein C8Q70DRAFT_933581 [Cubamyces menziesii]
MTSVPGPSTATPGPSSTSSARRPHAASNITTYNYVVCIHTEDLLMKTQTAPFFKPTHATRVPNSNNKMTPFVQRFREMGLAFDLSITARADDYMANHIQRPLEAHMRERGLQLSDVEGIDAGSDDRNTFSCAWQYLVVAVNGRPSTHGGRRLEKIVRPWTGHVPISLLNSRAQKLHAFAPPYEKHLLLFIAPVSRVVIGPVPQDSVLSQPRSSLRPYGPLHLCLGLRAWPESHVNGVSCVPGCEGFNGGLGDEQSQPMSSIADEVVLDNYLGMRVAQNAFASSSWQVPEDNYLSMPSLHEDWGLQQHYQNPNPHLPAPSASALSALSTSSALSASSSLPPLSPPSAPPVASASDALFASAASTPSFTSAALTPALTSPVLSLSSALASTPPPCDLSSPSAPTSITPPESNTANLPQAVNAPLPPMLEHAERLSPRSAALQLCDVDTREPTPEPQNDESELLTIHEHSLGRTLSYLEESAEVLSTWRSLMRSFLPEAVRPEGISITAPTVEAGAQGLLQTALSLATGELAPNTVTDEWRVMNASEDSIFTGYPTVTIGPSEAIGPGPIRAVFGHAIHLLVEDSDRWIQTSGGQFYTPIIHSTGATDDDIQHFTACGILLQLAVFWDQDLLPISPMLFALVLGGVESATDLDFLYAVAPDLARRLATWPPPRTQCPISGDTVYAVHHGRDPMNLILELLAGYTQVMPSSSCHEAQAEGMRETLMAALLFHTQEIKEASLHPIFKAIRDGFNQRGLQRPGTDRIFSLLETFNGIKTARFVAAFCANRQILSYAALVPLLRQNVKVRPTHRGYDEDLDYGELAGQWMKAFVRYLSGTGHPNNAMFPTNATLGRGAALLRPTLFIRAVSDSNYLPRQINPLNEGSIQINFVSYIGVREHSVNASFHTCFTSMDVSLNKEVAAMLVEIPDDTSIATPFDVYIHAILLTTTQDYNTV